MCMFVGYRHVAYTNKSGKSVEGYSLYFEEERNDVVGVAVFDSWVSSDTFMNYFSAIQLNTLVELVYNRYGGVCGCHAK